MKIKKLLAIVLSVVISVTVSSMLLTSNVFSTEVGDKAAAIILDDIQASGDIIKQSILSKAEGKKYILLEFMSITCGPCVGNLPNLQKLNNDRDLSAVAEIRMISIDRNQKLVMDFLNKNRSKIDYSFSLDLLREAMKAYKITATPTTFIVDENGIVIYKHLGSYDEEIMSEIKDVLLK
ncbi:MAG: TlpA family protein disulfide reductase [Oligoflexia bacterium]|nr:TlpA family protein disulfide reductase [Oligoflexia bacterium]